VAGIVREYGVFGNWLWWAFLLSGTITTFCFARLWRQSGVRTDVEFYELRYSGRPAAWLRGFRGAEPGGGGYVVQRILAARNERQAAGATLLFNVIHYAVRPWPWILKDCPVNGTSASVARLLSDS